MFDSILEQVLYYILDVVLDGILGTILDGSFNIVMCCHYLYR